MQDNANAQIEMDRNDPVGLAGSAKRIDVGVVAQIGALVSAVLASACCWLPLVLLAFGISGGALSATFEAWRPVLLPVTFLFLGIAFYFTYRKPKAIVANGKDSTTGEACCVIPAKDAEAESCCPPEKAKGFSIKKMNKVLLPIITVMVLAFAFFPNYVGLVLGSGNSLANRDDLEIIVVEIEGMTCKACEKTIESSVAAVPGVEGVEVSYDTTKALIGIPKNSTAPRQAILQAISDAGYTGQFTDISKQKISIQGMTCEGCTLNVVEQLNKIPGVIHSEVNYQTGSATVSSNLPLSQDALKKAVKDAGYELTGIETETTATVNKGKTQ